MRSFEQKIGASYLGNAVVLGSKLRKAVGVIALALMITVWASEAFASDPARFALLIGNQDYTSAVGTLKNPKNDIAIIKLALLKVGFAEADITVVPNADRISMLEAFEKFAERVSGAGPDAISLFYYSGHGAADERRDNYLVPVDVPELYVSSLKYRAVALRDLLLTLSEAAPKAKHFVIFDACRNTLKLKQLGSKGLTEPKGFQPVQDIPGGMLIAFATAEGELASDLGEEAGPYARALAEEIVKPGVEAITVFRNVQLKMSESTGQKPWTQNGPMSAVYFARPKLIQNEPKSSSSEAAARRWNEIKEFEDVRIFQLFRKLYGSADPFYDALAGARIAELEAVQPQPGIFRQFLSASPLHEASETFQAPRLLKRRH